MTFLKLSTLSLFLFISINLFSSNWSVKIYNATNEKIQCVVGGSSQKTYKPLDIESKKKGEVELSEVSGSDCFCNLSCSNSKSKVDWMNIPGPHVGCVLMPIVFTQCWNTRFIIKTENNQLKMIECSAGECTSLFV